LSWRKAGTTPASFRSLGTGTEAIGCPLIRKRKCTPIRIHGRWRRPCGMVHGGRLGRVGWKSDRVSRALRRRWGRRTAGLPLWPRRPDFMCWAD